MAQKEIEVILTRQLASYLAMPAFVVDSEGTLVFYNEPAEVLLGKRFEETGEMPASEWSTAFSPTDGAGEAFPVHELPLVVALEQRRPAHRDFWIRGMDNVPRHIEATAFPLVGIAGRYLGAVALFWETES